MNSTLMVSSEKTNKVNERKVRGSLKNTKKKYMGWLVFIILMIYYFIFMGCWFGFESIVASHHHVSKEIFATTTKLYQLHFTIGDGLNAYISLATQELSKQYMTSDTVAMLQVVMKGEQPYAFFKYRMERDMEEAVLGLLDTANSIIDSSSPQAEDILNTIFRPLNSKRDLTNVASDLLGGADLTKMNRLQSLEYIVNGLSHCLATLDTYFSGPNDKSSPLHAQRTADITRSFALNNRVYLNKALQDVLPDQLEFVATLKNATPTFDLMTYTEPFTYLLIGIGIAFAVCFSILLTLLVLIQKELHIAMCSYNFLMKEDLIREIEKIAKANSFLTGNLFDEQGKMDEAYHLIHIHDSNSIYSKKSREKIDAKTKANTNTNIDLDLDLAMLARKGGIMKNKIALSRSSGMSLKRPYTNVIVTFTLSIILKSLITLGILLMLLVDTKVKQNNVVKSVALKVAEDISMIHQTFSMMMMYSPYTVNLIEDRNQFPTPEQISQKFDENVQTFMVDVQNLRTQIQETIGANNAIETLMFGDMCTLLVEKPNDLEATNYICQELNYKIATRGFMHYCISEKRSLSVVETAT